MSFTDNLYRTPKECAVWSTSLHPFGPRNYFCCWRDKPGLKWLTVNCWIKSGIQVTVLWGGSLRLSCCLQKEEICFGTLKEHSAQCMMGLTLFFLLQKSLMVWGRFWNTFGHEQILTIFHNYLLHCKWMYFTVITPVGNLRNSDKYAFFLHWFQAGWVLNMLFGCLRAFGSYIGNGVFYLCRITEATIALLFNVLFHCSCSCWNTSELAGLWTMPLSSR